MVVPWCSNTINVGDEGMTRECRCVWDVRFAADGVVTGCLRVGALVIVKARNSF